MQSEYTPVALVHLDERSGEPPTAVITDHLKAVDFRALVTELHDETES
ncbi:MAG TPA: hypothetical protein VFC13_23075 [Actinomycetes bacterium]|jgi:hypothetical protein|nr:hypothetical protein [Actinomycetes bacterium]